MKSSKPFEFHFEEQLQIYNKQTIINLVKKKGSEKILGDTFENYIHTIQKEEIKYVSFDLHHHCGNSKFEKLSILINEVFV